MYPKTIYNNYVEIKHTEEISTRCMFSLIYFLYGREFLFQDVIHKEEKQAQKVFQNKRQLVVISYMNLQNIPQSQDIFITNNY